LYLLIIVRIPWSTNNKKIIFVADLPPKRIGGEYAPFVGGKGGERRKKKREERKRR
jgi:hypothetical protein